MQANRDRVNTYFMLINSSCAGSSLKENLDADTDSVASGFLSKGESTRLESCFKGIKRLSSIYF